MSRFKNLADAQQAHIFTLRAIIAALVVICLAMWYGWKKAPNDLTIHVPPDLRSGSTRLWWDIPPENVYGFALYIFSQLNRWPNDGEQDFPRALHNVQNFITPSCKAVLQKEFDQRRNSGELRNRVRGVYEILGRGYPDDPAFRVKSLGRDAWRVTLDLTADEYYLTEHVKRALARYPLRVVRFDVDAEKNPYGLALDCYDGAPQKLELPDGKEKK